MEWCTRARMYVCVTKSAQGSRELIFGGVLTLHVRSTKIAKRYLWPWPWPRKWGQSAEVTKFQLAISRAILNVESKCFVFWDRFRDGSKPFESKSWLWPFDLEILRNDQNTQTDILSVSVYEILRCNLNCATWNISLEEKNCVYLTFIIHVTQFQPISVDSATDWLGLVGGTLVCQIIALLHR